VYGRCRRASMYETDTLETVGEVRRCQTLCAVVDKHSELVLDPPLLHLQSMQLSEKRRHVVIISAVRTTVSLKHFTPTAAC